MDNDNDDAEEETMMIVKDKAVLADDWDDRDELANDEEDGKDDEGGEVRKVKIIYCSRTHSQVAQMVAS